MFDLPPFDPIEISARYEVPAIIAQPLFIALDSGQQNIAPVRPLKREVVTLPNGSRLEVEYPQGYHLMCADMSSKGEFPEQEVDAEIRNLDGSNPDQAHAIEFANNCSITKAQ